MNRIILATGLMTALVVSAIGPGWSGERAPVTGLRVATIERAAAPMDFDGFVRSIAPTGRDASK